MVVICELDLDFYKLHGPTPCPVGKDIEDPCVLEVSSGVILYS